MNNLTQEDAPAPFLTGPPAPHPALWLFHLFLFPKQFFSYFDSMATPFATAYAAIIVGIADACSSISDQLTKQEFTGRTRVPPFVVESWRNYWLVCVGAGLVSAVLFYHLGGWWYRRRLIWAGDPNPNKSLAKRVYMFTCLVPALPFLILTLVDSATYATPLEADREGGWWWLAMLVLVFWSSNVSYQGVRVLFQTTCWRARTWFLFLPLTFYGAMLGGFMLLAILGAEGIINIPPDVNRPHTIKRSGFTLQYPGNWWIDDQSEDYDADHNFGIEPPQDAMIYFFVQDEPSDPVQCVGELVENYDAEMKIIKLSAFEKWGRYSGAGRALEVETDGSKLEVRAFCSTNAKRSFAVLEWVNPGVGDKIEPGLQLIRKTFVLVE